MSDRHEQARAEAKRRLPDALPVMRGQDRIIFTQGVEWADANPEPPPTGGRPVKPADEMRALTCHCGRIACRHHTGATMNPITSLTLAHVGTCITLHDQGNIITGALTAIEAEREIVTIAAYGTEQRVDPGRWEHITLTIGDIRADVSPHAQWEDA